MDDRLTAARSIAAAWIGRRDCTTADLLHAMKRIVAACDGEAIPAAPTVMDKLREVVKVDQSDREQSWFTRHHHDPTKERSTMILKFKQPGGRRLTVDTTNVVEVNSGKHKGERCLWICFKGGGASPVTAEMSAVVSDFCPPLIEATHFYGKPVLVNPKYVARIDEGQFQGRRCCWIGYDPEHDRKAVAVLCDYQTLSAQVAHSKDEPIKEINATQ